jgi:excisionase family DNA binding protein
VPGGPTLLTVDGGKAHLLSVQAVAARLGVSRATVYGLVARGDLPHFRISNAVRVAPADLDGYLVTLRSGCATPRAVPRRREGPGRP